ncbi:MAG: fibronectin type III domain-containing protein [Candidatus Paceibacterota bacterium]
MTGLSNGSSYTFTVTATNIVGTSSSSTISAPITPATVPDAPTIGSVTAGNGQATVTFTPPVSNGGSSITYYTVTSSGGQTATGGSSPITVLGLNNGTTYTFTVTATNAVGTSTPSSTK